LKKGEEDLLEKLVGLSPDALLVRNLGSLAFFRELAPSIPRVGDFPLNAANELTAAVLLGAGLSRWTPSCD
jgi:putative protease